MATKANGFEAGTTGNNVLTSDTGDPNAFTERTVTATGTITYSDTRAAHGTLSGRFTALTTGDKNTLGWTSWAATTLTMSLYLYFDNYPSGTMDLAAIRNSTAMAGKLQIGADGKIKVVSAGGGVLHTFASAIGTDAWIRVELSVTKGAGASDGRVQCAYYAADATSATDSYDSGTTTGTGTTNLLLAYVGALTSTVTVEFWGDSFQVQDAALPLGPWPDTPLTFSVNDDAGVSDAGITLSHARQQRVAGIWIARGTFTRDTGAWI